MTAHPADPDISIPGITAGRQAGRPPAHPTATSRHPTSRHPDGAVPPHLAGEWALFTDWCSATSRHPLPVNLDTVLAFLADLPASPAVTGRRARAIRAAHTGAGLLTPSLSDIGGSDHTPATVGQRLIASTCLTPADALRSLPIFEHPAAVPARRDGVLILMCLVLSWPRRQARQATADVRPVPRLGNLDLPLGADPATCPGCVLTRWLRVLAADVAGSRPLVETVVADSDRRGHDCCHEVPDGWAHRPLLPAIDRHGWIDPHRTLTARSISTRLRQATQPRDDQPPTAVPAVPPAPLTIGRRDHATLHELDDLLTRLESALDRQLA
jgi:hypothetical protein